jgi:hypothetical protein
MLSTLHTSARAAVLTVLVAGAVLVVPTARAQSVTPDRALLNRLQAVPIRPVTALIEGNARRASVEPDVIDGERVLLNRFRAARAPLIADPGFREAMLATPGPDGVRALLNR